jgi:glycosyltransferase involved in cell wall biosynthesis
MNIDLCGYDGPDSTGGPNMWLQRMPLALRNLGYTVRIFLFTWQEPAVGAGFIFLQHAGFEVAVYRFGNTADNVRWLLGRMQCHPPDVFVANHVVPALHAANFLRRWGIPTVGVIRSDDDFYRGLVDAFVFGPKSSRISALVCVSDFLEKSVSARKPQGILVKRIPSGTPLPESTVVPPSGILKIVYVGRLVEEQKRASDLARALCRVTKEIPDVEAVLIGDGPARDSIESVIQEERADALRLLGHLDGEAVLRELLVSHVIVLLSDYEGTPTAVMESMACGCVPVCLRIRSGIPELVEHGVTGLLVEDRGDSFVAAIRRLREEPELWIRLSQGARARIQAGFSTKWAAEQWSGLLEELRSSKKSSPPLRMPAWITLPPVHPALAHQDVRAPSVWQKSIRLIKRSRFHLGRIRRQLLGPKMS